MEEDTKKVLKGKMADDWPRCPHIRKLSVDAAVILARGSRGATPSRV